MSISEEEKTGESAACFSSLKTQGPERRCEASLEVSSAPQVL